MKTALMMFTVLGFLTCCVASASPDEEEKLVSVITELKRMRTADHLYQPDDHQLVQYSGFNRKGGNPDRMHCLYEEDGWRVVADQKGPGVVTRMWTPAREQWSEIRVELDGKIIFEGRSEHFFGDYKYPFSPPLTEVRLGPKGSGNSWMYRKGEKPPKEMPSGVDLEDEQGEKKKWSARWGESHVPLPFKTRFRYMQRGAYYANMEIKVLPPGTRVQSYNDTDWEKVRPEWEKTQAVWKRVSLYGEDIQKYHKVAQTIKFAEENPDVRAAIRLDGPGIVRSIRVKVAPELRRKIFMKAWWDGDERTGIDTSLDLGFGSRKYRTLALGQGQDGWRHLEFPMPFRKAAAIRFMSVANTAASIEVEIYYEKKDSLPKDVMYLHGFHHADKFTRGKSQFLFPDVPKKEFLYHNGYTAVDLVGSGHLVAYMDLYHCQPELDEHIFVDGERSFPENVWNGTGHEDLFGMAHAHKEHTAPMTSGGSESQKEANVRLFWNGTMAFKKEIRWNWEWSFMLSRKQPPRDATFESVVYWYSKPGSITVKRPTVYASTAERSRITRQTFVHEAAAGRLYMATCDGSVVCLAAKSEP